MDKLRLSSFLVILLLISGCGNLLLYVGQAETGAQAPWFPPPKAEPGKHIVSVISTELVVPSKGLPHGTLVRKSNNNVSVTRHEGRVWMAWRTGKSHFASDRVTMQIVSSSNEKTWRYEHFVDMGSDLREPILFSWKGKLFFYFTKLGKNSIAYEPRGMFLTVRNKNGKWSGLDRLGVGNKIGWRIRIEKGKPYLIAYDNGESLYTIGGPSLSVHLLTTDDGWSWRPVDPRRPTIHTGGGSETDFTFADSGTLYGVMRNEFGENGRYGSLVCTAPSENMTKWSCSHDPRKFDSPHVFKHDGEVYLLARRNITKDGHFERQVFMRNIRNHLSYIIKAKRCSLWRFADKGKRLAFVMDLPSRGDTCFPSVLKGNKPDQVIVYDYSSAIVGPDSPWSVGQRQPTYIYRHVLSFKRK